MCKEGTVTISTRDYDDLKETERNYEKIKCSFAYSYSHRFGYVVYASKEELEKDFSDKLEDANSKIEKIRNENAPSVIWKLDKIPMWIRKIFGAV